MQKIMKSWRDLQSKRRKELIKMEHVSAFMVKNSVHYKIFVKYDQNNQFITLQSEDEDTYQHIVLTPRNVNGFHEEGQTIIINQGPKLGSFTLHFTNQAHLTHVIQLLRCIGGDESTDSNSSTPPPPGQ